MKIGSVLAEYGLFSEMKKNENPIFNALPVLISGFGIKPEMTAKWMRFSQKRNFEYRFINSKANVDYVGGGEGGGGGGEEEVRLNSAYLGQSLVRLAIGQKIANE